MGLQKFRLLFKCLGLSQKELSIANAMLKSYCMVWCLAVLLSGLLSTLALAAPATQEDLSAQKELVQVKIDALKDLQQKDIDAVKSRMDAIDKRLDDQISKMGQGVDRLGVYASILGIIVTALLAVLGLLGYFTVVGKAKTEAQESAKQWFDNNAKQLNEKILNLETEVQAARQRIENSVKNVEEHGEGAIDRQNQAVQTLEASIGNQTGTDSKKIHEAKVVVTERAEQLKQIAESSYSFEDWNMRAHAAYAADQLEKAALYWLNASQVPNAGSVRVAQALYNRGVAQGKMGQSEAAFATYDEVTRRYGEASETALRDLVARALVNKGATQVQLGQSKAAITTYEEVIRSYGEATEVALREQVAQAIFNKGVTQMQQGQSEAAIATYEEIIRRYGETLEVVLHEQVAKAMVNKGATQGKLGQSAAAISTYEEVIRRYGEAPEAALRVLVAGALVNKGSRQGKLGQYEAEIATYQEVIRRYGEAPEVAFREHVARALVNKVCAQVQLGQGESAINTCKEVNHRYREAPELSLRELVAISLVNEGVVQGQLGQSKAAIAIYEEVIHRYDRDPETALRKQVADAHNGIGFVLICDGKLRWSIDSLTAEALWRKALEHTDKAVTKLEVDKMDGLILGNQAYALALLGEVEQAESIFAQALRSPVRGGKELYDGTLTDFDIHPIAKDQAMRDLVERQWRIWTAEQDKSKAPESA